MYANQYQTRPPMGGPTGGPPQRFGYSGGSGQSGQSDKKWGDTTSKSGEISRIFVGSVDYKTTSCEEIEQRFQKYGIIRGIDIHPKNFAFVQFDSVDGAQNACSSENGAQFKTRKIDVRLFDKTGHPTKGRPERSRSPNNRQQSAAGNSGNRRPMGGPTGTKHGSFIPNQFDDPSYGYGAPGGGAPPTEPIVGNEAEIIVVNREQWSYADMIEKRIKAETGIHLIDMLFLHSPSSLNMTLNDLFERQTLYALVIAPVNEEHRSVTLHVLHNQTEHRNMPLEDAVLLIAKDFQAFTGRSAPAVARSTPAGAVDRSYPSQPYGGGPTESKLPEEISYIMRTILDENGTKFMSLTQIDLLIDYLQTEKAVMLTRQTNPSGQPKAEYEKQKANLLDNPHVQAALSSLIQIGALGSSSEQNSGKVQSNNGVSSYGSQYQSTSAVTAPTLRHPLLGTEVNSNKSQMQMAIPGAPGGLVGYPPPQSYNQYSYSQY